MSTTTPVNHSSLAARKISPLRQRMIDDMTVRNFAPNTMLAYLKQVTYFAQYFGKSPERLGPEEIRSYQIYLVKEKKVSVSSRTVATSALRFLYAVTWRMVLLVPCVYAPVNNVVAIVAPGCILHVKRSYTLLM